MILKNKGNEENYESSKECIFHFSPDDVSIKDDGFHGSTAPRFTEWWYFDAVFDNGYSAQISLRFLSIIKNHFVIISQRLDIYKDGILIKHDGKRYYSLKKLEVSDRYPLVKLDKNQVIKGEVNRDGRWVYILSFILKNASANLIFEGCTEGWKGKNPGGDWWAVLLPRAEVKGTLTVNGIQLNVRGIGYHDHNWDVRSKVGKDYGWFWGKINFNTFTATWATIFKNKFIGQPTLVINENDKSYINILPKDIEFKGSDVRKNNRNYIPYHFDLKAKTENIDLDVSMDVSRIHYVKKMLKIRYWRFHVSCKGSITVYGKTEKVNEMQIAEFMKFK